jgi:hypothetical protein
MKYENLKDQSSDAQNALTFLPKSMVASITKSKDPILGRKKDWTVRIKDKKPKTDSSVLPKDLDISMLGDRDAQEKKNVMIASGLGIFVIVLLVYILFLR